MISNQVHFSLAHPEALDDLVPFAERENRIVIAYSPLAQGLLGGKYGIDNRPVGSRAINPLFGTENLRRIEPLLQTLRDVAAEVDAKPAQVALAWLISLPGVVAIPGASSVEQLEFNVAAADIELSAESRDALTAAARAFRPVSTGRFVTDLVREKLAGADVQRVQSAAPSLRTLHRTDVTPGSWLVCGPRPRRRCRRGPPSRSPPAGRSGRGW